MKKFFFYLSILILCILVWLNKKNKEGIENENVFYSLTIENLRAIYEIIDNNTSTTTKTTTTTNSNTNTQTNEDTDTSMSYSNVNSNNEDDDNENTNTNTNTNNSTQNTNNSTQNTNTNTQPCLTNSEIILKIRELDIKDDALNSIINQDDLNKAYESLMIKLNSIPTVIYKTCDSRKSKNKKKTK